MRRECWPDIMRVYRWSVWFNAHCWRNFWPASLRSPSRAHINHPVTIERMYPGALSELTCRLRREATNAQNARAIVSADTGMPSLISQFTARDYWSLAAA